MPNVILLCLLLSLTACGSAATVSPDVTVPVQDVSGYLLVQIDDITAPDGFAAYQQATLPTLMAHQAAPLAATSTVHRLEGESSEAWTVILKFESEKSVNDWYSDPAYVDARRMRQQSVGVSDMVVVGGFAGSEGADLTEIGAYILVQISSIDDPDMFRSYQQAAQPTLVAHGAVPLVVGQPTTLLEGSWPGALTVVLGFSSVQAAQDWYNSPEYQAVKLIRQESTSGTSMVIVEAFVPSMS